MSSEPDPTHATPLTSSGRGGIAVIRLTGEFAVAAFDRCFRPHRGVPFGETSEGRPRFGRFGPEPSEDVVAIRVERDPPRVEIYCHGGAASVARAREVLVASGATWIEAQTDDAEMALATATTLRTAQILQDQVDGAWNIEREKVIDLAAQRSPLLLPHIDGLLDRGEVGLRLIPGWRVVLTGRPNVGKSRLMNALSGYERSVVSASAGTTRDVVTCRLSVDGWPVEIADTAGFRRGESDLESSGIALALEQIEAADLVILVLDRSRLLEPADFALIDAHPRALLVANKSDLPGAWEVGPMSAIRVSAASGEGVGDLLRAISSRLVPVPPPPGSAVPFLPSQVEWLKRMRVDPGPPPSTHAETERSLGSSGSDCRRIGNPLQVGPRGG